MVFNEIINEDKTIVIITDDNWDGIIKRYSNINFESNYFQSNNSNQSFVLSLWTIPMSVFYALIIIFGLLANLWVITSVFIVLRRGNHRTISVLVYIISLSLLNILILLSMPITITDFLLGNWPFPDFICKFHWIVESLNKTMASLIFSFLTVACYCAICRPQMKKIYQSKLYSSVNVFVGVVVITAVSLTMVQNVRVFHFIHVDKPTMIVKSVDKKCVFQPANEKEILHVTICSFVCGYAIPIATMSFCYGSILYLLRCRSPFRKRRIVQFRRVVRSVFMLVCFYLVSWTPYWIVMFRIYFQEDTVNETSHTLIFLAFVVHIFPYINCACSTFLYSILNKQIRTALRKSHNRSRK